MQSVIFDLDLTLVDTSYLDIYRQKRQWQEAYLHISNTRMYEGIASVMEKIRVHNIPCSIVSTAPRPYVEKIVRYYNLPVNYIVSYHDAHPIKPHPAQILKALRLMNCSPKNAISFGDRAIDIVASNAAGVESVACLWGTREKETLLQSKYSHVVSNPKEMIPLILFSDRIKS